MAQLKLVRWTALGLLATGTAARLCHGQSAGGEASAPPPSQANPSDRPQPTAASKAPAPAVDREDVLRRLWLDVAGRPPTRQELDEVLRDPSPRAYQTALDRLTGRGATGTAAAAPRPPGVPTPPAAPTAPAPLRAAKPLPTVEPRTVESKQQDAATAALHEAGRRLVTRPTLSLAKPAQVAKPLPPSPLPAGPYVTLSGPALRATFAAKRVKAAYLGVGVEAPSDVVRSQLKLGDGAGLVVNHVDAEGPSKDALKQHDVLQRLDDQILVNPEQLVTLVRMKKQGETVALTLIREAKAVTVEIKVGEREVADAGAGDAINFTEYGVAGTDANLVIGNLLDPVRPAADPAPYVYWANTLSAVRAGPIKVEDGQWVVLLTDGPDRELTLINAATGAEVFKGPPLTGQDDPRAKDLPADAKDKLLIWQNAVRPAGTDAGAGAANGLLIDLGSSLSPSAPTTGPAGAAESETRE